MHVLAFISFLQDRCEDWDGYRHLGQYARWSVTISVVSMWTGDMAVPIIYCQNLGVPF
jgi:hypothetical protein